MDKKKFKKNLINGDIARKEKIMINFKSSFRKF
jgi:hypothetical protein